jgi:two-component system sensor histidine kinase DesK
VSPSGGTAPRRGWLDYLYLVYLIYLFAQPFFTKAGWLHWFAACLVIALFLPLYFRVADSQEAQDGQPAWLIALLGFGASFFNSGASVLYIYAAAGLALVLPRAEALRAFRLLSLVALLQAAAVLLIWQSYFVLIPFGFALVFLWVVGFSNLTERERRVAAARLRLAHDEIEQLAKVAERERIARDMHDVLGHSLSVVILKSELAVRLAERDLERALAEIRDVERISRQALQEVRTAISGYRSAGLAGELANAQLALDAAGVMMQQDLEHALQQQPLPLQIEATLALVLREAITNVIRHAQATLCTVRLEFRQGGAGELVMLEISDDGKGSSSHEGSGLSGMRQRVAGLGGNLQRRSAGGTTLTVTVPLES